MPHFLRPIALIVAFALALLGVIMSNIPPAHALPFGKCDVNSDGKVTLTDINLIRASIGQPVTGPADPRDANSDGKITVNDARACTQQCTFPGCAES